MRSTGIWCSGSQAAAGHSKALLAQQGMDAFLLLQELMDTGQRWMETHREELAALGEDIVPVRVLPAALLTHGQKSERE